MPRTFVLAALLSMMGVPIPAHAQDPDLTLVNVDPNGNPVPPGGSLQDISGNGRYVVFHSQAPLLPDDTIGGQIYLHDLATGNLEIVSRDAGGAVIGEATVDFAGAGSDPTNRRVISDDGRYVLFGTTAANVIPGVDPPGLDVYVYRRDRVLQETRLVSVNSDDEPPNLTVEAFTMDPTGTAVLLRTFADNMDPEFAQGPWFLHRIDAPVGRRVRTRAACRDRDGIPRSCNDPAISCGGAIIAAEIRGAIPWIEGEELGFGGLYNDIAIGNTIAGNWVRLGREADQPLPPNAASSSIRNFNPVINCSGNRIAFWTSMPLRLGDTGDDDLYVFDLLSRQLWLIEQSPGVSLGGVQGYRTVSMSSNGLQIAFNSDLSLDPADDNGFNDVYAFEMPINPPSLDFDFHWVSNNDGVAPISLFTTQPVAGGNGVVGFRTSATNAPWNPLAGSLGAIYVRSNLLFEILQADGFE